MRTTTTIKHIPDSVVMHSEASCNLSHWYAVQLKLLHLTNFLRAKFTIPMIITFRHSASAFNHLISHIIRMSAKKEMIGIYAARVVAFMKYPKTIFDRALEKLIRKPMSAVGFALNRKGTISGFLNGAGVKPTSVCAGGCINLREKTNFRGWSSHAPICITGGI